MGFCRGSWIDGMKDLKRIAHGEVDGCIQTWVAGKCLMGLHIALSSEDGSVLCSDSSPTNTHSSSLYLVEQAPLHDPKAKKEDLVTLASNPSS